MKRKKGYLAKIYLITCPVVQESNFLGELITIFIYKCYTISYGRNAYYSKSFLLSTNDESMTFNLYCVANDIDVYHE